MNDLFTEKPATPNPNRFYQILLSIFSNNKVERASLNELTEEDKSDLFEMLKKKFYVDEKGENYELKKYRRRNEEQIKFVLKKGFRRLFIDFKKNNNNFLKGNKLLDELEFYTHYFRQPDSDVR